ncbi:membrane protein [Gordonia phage Dorito]|uniref:Membrane protein n=1 Tax=Gordonia phage Dorito TaxID=2499023 RepID=A0A3S9UAJ3_9CAUD|nr:membrane protein [Gordonia phage Dorito]AZS07293.1 membrane protein [Gordonia phage Dorito]
MTPTQLALEIVRAVGYGAIGVFIGMAFTWRKTSVRGVEVRVPTAHPDGRVWRRAIGALLVVVAVLSLTQSTVTTARRADDAERQGRCNQEFRRVIKERGDAALEQSELWSRLERELAAIGPAVTLEKQQQIVAARKRYVVNFDRLTEQRKANPYPDPRC